MIKQAAITMMNKLGKANVPFLFVIDFEMKASLILPVADINPNNILFNFTGFCNYSSSLPLNKPVFVNKLPVPIKKYEKAFKIVLKNLTYGNSFLVNLTFPTTIKTNLTLKEIFFLSDAKYKLYLKNKFVVFSPETFVRIKNNRIFSYPMKGTIDASLPNAEHVILNDKKEMAEHNTIVDLIRNDLSMVAGKVRVTEFRYIDRIKTHEKELLQVSSVIEGELEETFNEKIGNIIFTLLPAGSISGAPKNKTVEIIKKAETYNRGYYTGITGYFDGKNLDSCVMIRFIEKTKQGMIYKSGGGITVNSIMQNEYQELIDKVYVPII